MKQIGYQVILLFVNLKRSPLKGSDQTAKIADLSIQDVTARRVERREKNTIGYEFDSPEVIQEVDIDLHYLSFDEAGAPIGTKQLIGQWILRAQCECYI